VANAATIYLAVAREDPLTQEPIVLSNFVRLPKRADARRSYERLLASAVEQFAVHGLNVPLDDIARGAGVGSATLYRHFSTRQELIVAISAKEFEPLSARGYELIKTLPPGEAAEEWFRYLLSLIKSKRGLAAAMLAAPAKETSVVTTLFAYMEATASLLVDPAKAVGALRSDLRSSEVVRLITAVAFATEPDPPKEIDRVLALMVDGLRPASS
jgi:AcrR family transcriptional regulator